nr:hypothetical protein [Thermoanaerobacterales bacterium]
MSELFELGLWQVAFWWLVGTVVVASVWVVLAGQHRTVWTDRAAARWAWPVSYTNLSLPPKRRVEIVGVGGRRKKNRESGYET